MLTAAFMDLLDTTIVNVAIPSIRSGLDAGYASLQWIVAGYLLAVAVGLITFGRLGDSYGRRRLFLIGVVGFGLSSLGCGLAPTPAVLIVSRLLQGTFAAMMIPQILSTIHVSFAPAEKPRALALYSTIAGLAVMSGPLVGGVLLSELNLSWRFIFLINVPVSIAVAVGARAIVPESKSDEAKRPDFAGAALISGALFALVFSLIQGRDAGWPVWIFALIALSVALVAVFVWYERRKERRGESPLITMRLFHRRAVSVGLLVVLVLYSGIVGFWLSLAIYLQIGLGYTPIQAALTTVPSSIGLIMAAGISTKRAPRPGRVLLACGAVIMAVAMAGLIVVFTHYGGMVSAWQLRPLIFVLGLGMGLTIPPLADAIIAQTPERVAGAASGLINSGLQVGNAVGVAVIGVILFGVLSTHAPTSARSEAAKLSAQLAAQGVPAAQRQQVTAEFRTCFVDASRQKDPAAVPASCRKSKAEQTDPALSKAATVALEKARKDNFSVAIARAVGYSFAAFLVAALLLLFLNPNAAEGRGTRNRYGYAARHAAGRAPPVLAA
ncbi:MAG TPA: MFS transporter [Jatrophihabitans sp.]|nr:MFS transporter [Jatrophihabitans sp.]